MACQHGAAVNAKPTTPRLAVRTEQAMPKRYIVLLDDLTQCHDQPLHRPQVDGQITPLQDDRVKWTCLAAAYGTRILCISTCPKCGDKALSGRRAAPYARSLAEAARGQRNPLLVNECKSA
jgi:hypothetical protein